MSKNVMSIAQLRLACRHVKEMIAAGVTENLAIRTLELFANVYAKLEKGGSATPHHVDQVTLWSRQAAALRAERPDALPRDHFRVEHGTPRRQFARLVMALYDRDELTADTMAGLVDRHWKLAIITVDEGRHLNALYRSALFDTPEDRWKAAGIEFELPFP